MTPEYNQPGQITFDDGLQMANFNWVCHTFEFNRQDNVCNCCVECTDGNTVYSPWLSVTVTADPTNGTPTMSEINTQLLTTPELTGSNPI